MVVAVAKVNLRPNFSFSAFECVACEMAGEAVEKFALFQFSELGVLIWLNIDVHGG